MTMPNYATLALRGKRIIDNSWKPFVEALLIPPQVNFSYPTPLFWSDGLLTSSPPLSSEVIERKKYTGPGKKDDHASLYSVRLVIMCLYRNRHLVAWCDFVHAIGRRIAF